MESFLPDEQFPPVPNLQRSSKLNQNNFREIKLFSTESEIIQNKFWISLIQRKIQNQLSLKISESEQNQHYNFWINSDSEQKPEIF